MNAEELDLIIARFRDSGVNVNLYKYGKCSEFAVALKLFINGKTGKKVTMKDLTTGIGDIYKHGLFHVCLKYLGYYWDIRGCQTEREMLSNDPTALNKEGNRKAQIHEIKHLYDLLDRTKVIETIQGLKKARLVVI